ncbi:hypothetical protein BH739_15885 [Enterococcus casseliflavus]|nr:hypothetical protein BH739_15885 [Enterococcus casseliflavus]
MKSVMDNINKWTVGGITSFYETLVGNTYFIISNLLGMVVLFLFKPTMNNLLLFIVPIFLLMQGILMQFHILPNIEKYSVKRFFKEYPLVLKKSWRVLAIATGIILMVIVDMNILMHSKTSRIFMVAVLITSMFLINSLLYIFLIESSEKSIDVSIRRKFMTGLLLSYRLPMITLKNIIFISIAIFAIQFMAIFYIVFIGGILNLLIWKNLNKRFSLDLYFEQVAA